MAPILLTAMLALSATALEEVVWSVVTYTYHGEKTPALFPGPYDLTPLGANQVYEAGQVIRDRYISGVANSSKITTSAIINGISQSAIDNSQLVVLSTDDPWISASAMAFLQALYPPSNSIVVDLESMLGNSSLAQYPLEGYQYPNIETLSVLDFNRLWIAGDDGCNAWDVVNVELLSSPAFVQEEQATSAFYESLGSSVFWAFDPSDLNYANAWTLWEYAAFEYQHNQSIYDSQTFTADDLDQLFNLASAQQWSFNTPDANGTLQAMAGRTYASFVLQQFDHQIASNGSAEKLTLMFGSFEPMLAFFALSNLATGPSASRFNSLPLHGSTMIFELYSWSEIPANQNESIPFPDTSSLRVRFWFRNGTDDSESLIEYPLFGRDESQDDMSWSDFVEGMADFSLDDLVDWCLSCESGSLFCEALMLDYSNGTTEAGSSKSDKGVSAPVAGVIGATVTIALGLIVAAVLALVGFRLDYHPRQKKGTVAGDLGVLKRTGSGTGGGFKGAEKLASDTDLTMKGGAGASVVRHERVGSWELNENPDKKHSSLDKDIENGGEASSANYVRRSEDGLGGVDPYGEPVKALDQV